MECQICKNETAPLLTGQIDFVKSKVEWCPICGTLYLTARSKTITVYPDDTLSKYSVSPGDTYLGTDYFKTDGDYENIL
jgi:hypothetical protein